MAVFLTVYTLVHHRWPYPKTFRSSFHRPISLSPSLSLSLAFFVMLLPLSLPFAQAYFKLHRSTYTNITSVKEKGVQALLPLATKCSGDHEHQGLSGWRNDDKQMRPTKGAQDRRLHTGTSFIHSNAHTGMKARNIADF